MRVVEFPLFYSGKMPLLPLMWWVAAAAIPRNSGRVAAGPNEIFSFVLCFHFKPRGGPRHLDFRGLCVSGRGRFPVSLVQCFLVLYKAGNAARVTFFLTFC